VNCNTSTALAVPIDKGLLVHPGLEIRDRTFEDQSFRGSGLSLITAAIVHWNTVYLDRAVQQLRAQGAVVPGDLLGACRPARLGAHRAHRRLRVVRGYAGGTLPAATRCSRRVPASRGLACSFEQIVR